MSKSKTNKEIKFDVINNDKAAVSVRIQNMKKYGRKTVTTKEELMQYGLGTKTFCNSSIHNF